MQLEAEASVSKELAASSPASPLLSGSGGSALDDKFKALEGGSSVDDELLAMKRALPGAPGVCVAEFAQLIGQLPCSVVGRFVGLGRVLRRTGRQISCATRPGRLG